MAFLTISKEINNNNQLKLLFNLIIIMCLTTHKLVNKKIKIDIKRFLIVLLNILSFIIHITLMLFITREFNSNEINEIFIADSSSGIFEYLFFFITQLRLLFQGKKSMYYFYKLIKINNKLQTLGINGEYKYFYKTLKTNLSILIFFYIKFIIINYFIFKYYETIHSYSFYEWTIFFCILTFNRLYQLLYGAIMLYIKGQFSIINDEINNIDNITTPFKIYKNKIDNIINNEKKLKIDIKKRLQTLIFIRNDLMNVCEFLNDYLGIRYLIFIGFNTVMLTFHIYIIIVTFMDNNESNNYYNRWLIIFYSLIWIMFRSINLISLVIIYTYTTVEVSWYLI